jgi:hypothetical protein
MRRLAPTIVLAGLAATGCLDMVVPEQGEIDVTLECPGPQFVCHHHSSGP